MERISKCSAPHEAKIIQSFVPNSFSSERNRLTRAHFQTFCSPNVACFCFASIFFVSVEPIITIRGLIIVMLSCTLSADFVFTRSSSQTIITPCVDAIFSAGVCDAALRSGRWSLRADLSFFSCLSLQRCQSRCGVPHRRILEHRRRELHQSRALRLRHDRRLRYRGTVGDAGLYLRRSDIML